jgi:adenylate cyclase, class 2
MIEREIKLPFASPEEAHAALLDLGATRLRDRRLQEDCLLDTRDLTLQRQGQALRLRHEAGTSRMTFKGPVQSAAMKVRDEIETTVGDGALALQLFEQLGFHPGFRSEKYREEYSLTGCIVAVDETPVGTFIEIEGSEDAIAAVAAALGRGPADYVLASYRALYVDACRQRGVAAGDMLFKS